jgi:hypothetical protein
MEREKKKHQEAPSVAGHETMDGMADIRTVAPEEDLRDSDYWNQRCPHSNHPAYCSSCEDDE